MKRIALCIALVIPTGLVEAGPLPLDGLGEGEPLGQPLELQVIGSCDIVIKARLDPGSVGADRAVVLALTPRRSRVRIRSGWWSQLGTASKQAIYIFYSDGSVYRRAGFNVYNQPLRRVGVGQISHAVELDLGCSNRRRYEFDMELQAGVNPDRTGGYRVSDIKRQFPSPTSWTTSQTIQLGNLAQYF